MNYRRWNPALFCVCAVLLFFAQCAAAQAPVLREAKNLFAAGSYAQSAALLQAHLRAHPQDADAHVLLGQVLAFEGERSGAIEQMTRAVALRPGSAETYDALGVVLSRFAEFPAARQAFERAVSLNPHFPQSHIHLGMALAQAGDKAGAERELSSAVELHPPVAIATNAHYLLGKLLEDSDSARALGEFTKSTQLDPNNAQAWFALGGMQRAANDQAAALRAFSKSVALNPADWDAQYELGSEYLAQGDAARAVQHLQLARRYRRSDSVAVLYKLDRALRKTGDVQQADAIRTKVQILITQDNQANRHALEAQSFDDEGVALEKKGELAQAAEKYRAALELNPEQSGFRLNYALALCRLKRWREGIDELNAVLEADPGNVEARRALYIARDRAIQ